MDVSLVNCDGSCIAVPPRTFALAAVVVDVPQDSVLRLEDDSAAVLETEGKFHWPLVLHLAQGSYSEGNQQLGSLSVLPELVPDSTVILVSVSSSQVPREAALKRLAVRVDACISLSGGYILKNSSRIVPLSIQLSHLIGHGSRFSCECEVAQFVCCETGHWLLHRPCECPLVACGAIEDSHAVRATCKRLIAWRDEINEHGSWQCLPKDWWEANGWETLMFPGSLKPMAPAKLRFQTATDSRNTDSVERFKAESPEKNLGQSSGKFQQHGASPPNSSDSLTYSKSQIDDALRELMVAKLTAMAKTQAEEAKVNRVTTLHEFQSPGRRSWLEDDSKQKSVARSWMENSDEEESTAVAPSFCSPSRTGGNSPSWCEDQVSLWIQSNHGNGDASASTQDKAEKQNIWTSDCKDQSGISSWGDDLPKHDGSWLRCKCCSSKSHQSGSSQVRGLQGLRANSAANTVEKQLLPDKQTEAPRSWLEV